MADERDEDLSRRYRELPREEPPRALDDAILAAARRELETRPAPLVAPTGRRRWAVPIAAAAVIVLSAVVTLHVQREQPDPESDGVSQSQPSVRARKDEAPAALRSEMKEEKLAAPPKEAEASRDEAPKAETRQRARIASAPKPATSPQAPAGESQASAEAMAQPKAPADPGRFTPDPAPAAAPAPPPPAPVPAVPPMQTRPAAPAAQPAPRAADSASTAGASPPAAAADRGALGGLRDRHGTSDRMLAKREAAPESPEKMLERIAALRREGRGKEADELYAEFRRRFPDHRIPDLLREQVVPR